MKSPAAPGINGVLETALYVDDLDRASTFYHEVLSLRLMKGDDARFRAFDDGNGRVLLLFARGGTLVPTPAGGVVIPPHDGSGPQHVGFAITAESYDAWKVRLAENQIVIESEGTWPR